MDLKGRTLKLKVEDRIYLVLPAKDNYDYVNIAIVELDPKLLESVKLGLATVEQLKGDKNFELLKYSTEAVNFYEVDIQKESDFEAFLDSNRNSEFDKVIEMNEEKWEVFNEEYLPPNEFPRYWAVRANGTIKFGYEFEERMHLFYEDVKFWTPDVSPELFLNAT